MKKILVIIALALTGTGYVHAQKRVVVRPSRKVVVVPARAVVARPHVIVLHPVVRRRVVVVR